MKDCQDYKRIFFNKKIVFFIEPQEKRKELKDGKGKTHMAAKDAGSESSHVRITHCSIVSALRHSGIFPVNVKDNRFSVRNI